MFKYVIYLKEHGPHRKGTIALYPETICEDLIKQKLVKYYKPKKREV